MKRSIPRRRSIVGQLLRSFCVAFLLAPFGLFMSLLALAASVATLSFSVVLFFLYRIFWMLGPEARRLRKMAKFEKCKKAIVAREQKRRRSLSRRYEQKTIGELRLMAFEQLSRREHEIMADTSVLARIQLSQCIQTLDFYSALEIYNILSESPADSLNQRLKHRLGPKRAGYLVYE